MKYVRFMNSDNAICYGLIQEEKIQLLDRNFLDPLCKPTNAWLSLDEVTLLAPVQPSKVICVGLNYALHVKEMNHSLSEEPLLFMKPPSCVLGPDSEIIYPKISQQVDYEAELAIVIGTTIKDVSEAEATKGIFGYTCANDVTAMDLQKKMVNGHVVNHLTRFALSVRGSSPILTPASWTFNSFSMALLNSLPIHEILLLQCQNC